MSPHSAERDADPVHNLVEAVRRYRDAVQAASPGASVQAAFLTGQGRLLVVTIAGNVKDYSRNETVIRNLASSVRLN